jgi:hypothetical protein
LLAPERHAKNPSSSAIINGFSLDNDDSYNELQSDSSESNNTANGRNKDLSTIPLIGKEPSYWVRFNGISDKNNLSLSVDVGFKFSKLPWTLNE